MCLEGAPLEEEVMFSILSNFFLNIYQAVKNTPTVNACDRQATLVLGTCQFKIKLSVRNFWYTVQLESIQTPWLVPHFVELQPHSKMYILFIPLNQHTITHNDKAKTVFYKMLANLLKSFKYINIQTLYSVLCWSTFGSDYSLKSSWVWRYKLGTPVFGEFLPFLLADPLKLCQVSWERRSSSEWTLGSWSPPWPRPFSHNCSIWPGCQL
jgi:hypothetical protein